jgi:hypothetical protein
METMAKQNFWIFPLTGPVALLTGCLLALHYDLGSQPDFSAIKGQLLSLALVCGVFSGYVDTALFESGREVAIKKGGMALARYTIEACATSFVIGVGIYAIITGLMG